MSFDLQAQTPLLGTVVAVQANYYQVRVDQGSGIRDQGSGIRDQGSGIRDQKNCTLLFCYVLGDRV